MDKWKDIELEKMKVGGNKNAREYFEEQPDWKDNMSIQQKYNTKAAALYRDKVSTLAQGQVWDEANSPAQNYSSAKVSTNNSSASSTAYSSSRGPSSSSMPHSKSYQDVGSSGGGGYQNNGAVDFQNINTPEFRDQKENFFGRMQEENKSRPE